mgnify:CR=1 FL=1
MKNKRSKTRAENTEKKTRSGQIDEDVLKQVSREDIFKALDDEKLLKRAEFNFFCELLSLSKKLNEALNDLNQLISVLGAEKIGAFYKTLMTNVVEEKKRLELQEKISQSHKKRAKKVDKTELN